MGLKKKSRDGWMDGERTREASERQRDQKGAREKKREQQRT